ncbi:hypothetical protein Glove_309g102 [Diversispora epigaea]|uniref:Uncharacterized protein n=1 Tax=Diversispora epigaea TaxID=1348612 RepID=A0A397HYC2_9GLOM|nr:hypothetical protein Glove_309g102 [Diversispora epigaea]
MSSVPHKGFLVGIEPTGKRNPKPLGSFDDPETRNPKRTGMQMIRPTDWAYRHLSGPQLLRTLTEDFHSDKADTRTMRNPQKGPTTTTNKNKINVVLMAVLTSFYQLCNLASLGNDNNNHINNNYSELGQYAKP